MEKIKKEPLVLLEQLPSIGKLLLYTFSFHYAPCGVLVRGMLDEKYKIDTFRGLAVVVRADANHKLENALTVAQKW